MRQRPVLFVCGGLTNLGDLALVRQNLAIAQAQGRRSTVRVWGALPSEITAQIRELGGEPVDGRRLGALARASVGSDIVIGGGQLLRDNASLRGLLYLLVAVVIARLAGGRVTTCGLGISPLHRAAPRALWRAILGRADSIAVRDARSEANARKFLPRQHVMRTADMAFLPGPLHQSLASDQTAHEGNTSPLLIAPCIERSEGRSIDGPAFQALIDLLRVRLGDRPTLVACHDPRPEIDGGAADALIATYRLGMVRKEDGYSLERLCGLYRTARFVVTNRFHSVIFALHAGCPILVVDDGTGKMVDLCETFAIPSVRIDGSQSAETLSEAVSAALAFDPKSRSRGLAEMAQRAEHNIRTVA